MYARLGRGSTGMQGLDRMKLTQALLAHAEVATTEAYIESLAPDQPDIRLKLAELSDEVLYGL
jgi:hypothetical protein